MKVYTAEGIAAEMGVTFRQLDYWTTQGFIKPTPLNGAAGNVNGTGNRRIWVGDQVDEAIWFARLVAVGFTPGRIDTLAERIVRDKRVHLPFGITLTVGGAA